MILISVILLPGVILATFFFVTYVGGTQANPTPADQIKVTGGDAKSTDTIQINIKDQNPSEDPEFKPPRKPVVPLPMGESRPSDPGKSN